MPLGEEGDFRSETFVQVNRFPGQYFIGGAGSPFLPTFTAPSGQSQLSFLPTGVPNYGGTSINFPGMWMDMQGPQVNFPSGTGGGTTGGTNTINVDTTDDGTGNPASYTGIDLIEFTGAGLVSVTNTTPGKAVVDYGGGGGASVDIGAITGSSYITAAGGGAAWQYTVAIYTSGSVSSTVTAYNTLERGNTTGTCYGYSVSGSPYTQLTGTSFNVGPVPTGAYVLIVNSSGPTGSSLNWFTAPNVITGTC
jgi:hypothetical protein